MIGAESVSQWPDKKIVITENAQDFATVGKVLTGQPVIYYDPLTDTPDALKCCSGRDCILFGAGALYVMRHKPKSLLRTFDPIPADFSPDWAKAHLEPYNTESEAPVPQNGGVAPSPTPSPDASDSDRDAMIDQLAGIYAETHVGKAIALNATDTVLRDAVGDDPDEDMPEGHPASETLPEGAYEPSFSDNVVSLRAFQSAKRSPDGGWGVPVDLLQISKQPVLDLSILPGSWQDYHGDIGRRTGCSLGISVLTDFAGMGAIIDDNYRVQPRENDWKFTERIGFFCLAVGGSASRKSTSMNAALEPFLDINRAEGVKAVRGIKEFALDQKKHAAVMQQYLSDNKKSAVWPAAPPEPEYPLNGVFAVKNSTPEGLRDMLMSNHNGILMYTDEIASQLGALGKYGNGKGAAQAEMGMLLQLYDGGEYPFARAGGGVVVPNWKGSLIAGTTESKLRDVLPSMDDGFLQRLLICNAAESKMGEDTAPDRSAIDLHTRILENLHGTRVAKTVLKFEPQAVEAYREFEATAHALIASEIYSPPMQSCISRWTGTVARIALLYQLCEFARFGQEARADSISVENVRMACDFLLKFQLPQQEYFWRRTVGQRSAAQAPVITSICSWIVARDIREFSLRDLSRANSGYWLPLAEKNGAQAGVMRLLEDAGWVDPDDSRPARGRGMAARYYVNPGVFPMYEGEFVDRLRAVRTARHEDLQRKRGVIPDFVGED